MACFQFIWQTAVAGIGCLAIAGSTMAQDWNRAAPRDLRRLSAEVDALQRRVTDGRMEMISLAELSANGPLDPAVQRVAGEVRQLERLLAQRTSELVARNTEIRQADLKTVLQSITSQLANVQTRLAQLEKAHRMATGKWRTAEVDGVQYYLVPVKESDPQDSSSGQLRRRAKVITTDRPAPGRKP